MIGRKSSDSPIRQFAKSPILQLVYFSKVDPKV